MTSSDIFTLALLVALLWTVLHFFKVYYAAIYSGSYGKINVRALLGVLLFGYFALIGTFGYSYHRIYHYNPTSFEFSGVPTFEENWFAAIYFSITTITTTGFGDVHPKSTIAMVATSFEMLVGYFMTVLFFSTVAGLAFRKMQQ